MLGNVFLNGFWLLTLDLNVGECIFDWLRGFLLRTLDLNVGEYIFEWLLASNFSQVKTTD